ncbi:MAG: TIGR03118 family protein [Acidobacteria bacterium]|nr:TIGR03118 family protein [Acidobacteriota bacterium]
MTVSPASKRRVRRSLSLALSLLFIVAFLPPPPAVERATGSVAVAQDSGGALIPNIAPGSAFRQTNLISDVPGLAPILDPLLVNPWGLTVRNASPFWVANNGTSTTQLIRTATGGGDPVVLNPNPQTISIPGGLPTGTVGNTTTDFVIPPPATPTPTPTPGPANFLFASITGNITAWNGNSGPAAQTVVAMPGHVWTGLAIGAATGGNRLYAADFANNHIDVFTGTFTPTTVTGGFIDATIPAGYAPFNIQNLGGSFPLYVTYAKVGMGGRSAAGVGLGFVRRFSTDGVRDLSFAINGNDGTSPDASSQLNAPWGLAIAPASFGRYGGALLVGNFGEGNASIHAYNPSTGAPLDGGDNALKNEDGQGIEIDELWALQFGNGGNGGDPNTLYFTAGPGEEEHGLFGKLNPTTATATSLIEFATDNFAVDEAGKFVDFTVVRTGDTSGTATVNYNTFDESRAGHASQKSDYEIALGTLNFAAGETSKTFRILIVDDKFVEGDETIDLLLSNPTGAGVGLGSPSTAEVTILDNDTTPPTTNPIDDPSFFVRQHYLDFLNREPDTAGLNFWTNEITSCGGNAACIENKRVNVSAAFFLSIEFQRTGYLAYLTHRAAFGANAQGSPAPVLYGNFERDVQALQRGFVFGQPGADAVLEANKVAYFNEFVTRPEFVSKYPSTLTNDQFVDNLLASAGLSPSQVRLFVVQLTNGQEVPPTVPTTTTGAARPASSGTARFQFNDAQTAMTFTATISNIDVTGSQTADTNDNLVAAHIHAGPSVAPGVNGPVVWGFFGSPFNDNNPNDQVFFPTAGAGAVGGTFSGKWDAPEGNSTTLAAQLDNLRSGRAYINFHTRQFAGGEIRGNFPAADTFRNQLVTAMNGGATRAQILRMVAEADELNSREFNAAFVTMEYFGYLRRDPDTAGFNFWLNKLNAFNGNFQNAEMVKAFISSSEYRQRFGPS